MESSCNFAPEIAGGAKHFKLSVFLGQPSIRFNVTFFGKSLKSPIVFQNLHNMAHLKANTHKFLSMQKNFNIFYFKGIKLARQKILVFQSPFSVVKTKLKVLPKSLKKWNDFVLTALIG